VIEAESVKQIVDLMIDRLGTKLAGRESRLGLLVNNLGGVPPLEMGVIVKEALTSPLGPRIELVFGPAQLMTSLDMKGFSLSLIDLDDQRREALLSPVGPVAWAPGARPAASAILPLPALARGTLTASVDDRAASVVRRVCDVLLAKEGELNALDARVGDGDTGTTFAAAARSVLDNLASSQLPLAHPDQLCLAIGELLSRAMGGSSGVLMSIFFTAAGSEIARSLRWCDALESGIAAVQRYGGAKAGDRTMLDALIPAVSALRRDGFVAAATAAREGADATASMRKAHAGRSSYVTAANLLGVKDPGAAAVALAFLAAADAAQTTKHGV
jgi:dihydroxyacetone kinase